MDNLDNNKRKKLTQAINFLEELSWLLDSKKNINLREAPGLLRDLLESSQLNSQHQNSIDSKFKSLNTNKNYLIGVLPKLFMDTELFKTNMDLADFAKSILVLSISRPEKRSKYELIGLIICEIAEFDEILLNTLTQALLTITNSIDRLTLVKEVKNHNADFSWNETIKLLSNL